MIGAFTDHELRTIRDVSSATGVPFSTLVAWILIESSGDWETNKTPVVSVRNPNNDIYPYIGLSSEDVIRWSTVPIEILNGNHYLQVYTLACYLRKHAQKFDNSDDPYLETWIANYAGVPDATGFSVVRGIEKFRKFREEAKEWFWDSIDREST